MYSERIKESITVKKNNGIDMNEVLGPGSVNTTDNSGSGSSSSNDNNKKKSNNSNNNSNNKKKNNNNDNNNNNNNDKQNINDIQSQIKIKNQDKYDNTFYNNVNVCGCLHVNEPKFLNTITDGLEK